MSSRAAVAAAADSDSQSSSEMCYDDDDVDDASPVATAAVPLPANAKIPLIVLDETDEELDEAIEKAAGDEYEIAYLKSMALDKARKAGANAARRTNELPTTMKMATDLGIDWIGAVDPGISNCAICVVSARDARIVYWRVIHLRELCELCEKHTDVRLKGDSDTLYSESAMCFAITWWCQQRELCPLARCDLVVVERQSFMRNMAEIQATWVAAFASHEPAVSVNAPLGQTDTYVMHVPKALVISSDSVKTRFKGFFPMVQERPPPPATTANGEAVTPANRRKRTYTSSFAANRQGPHGIGDAHGDPVQYAANKANSKKWCLKIIGAATDAKTGKMKRGGTAEAMSEAAEEDFVTHAVDVHRTMSTTQTSETTARLATAKSDDLADAMFMAFYAADFLIGAWWIRALGPTAKRHTTRYVYGEAPSLALVARVAPEARHQILFAYIRYRVKADSKSIKELVDALV